MSTAAVFIEAFQNLSPKEQLGIYDWLRKRMGHFEALRKQSQQKEEADPDADQLYALSMQSFAEDWDAPENDHWDEFFQEQNK